MSFRSVLDDDVLADELSCIRIEKLAADRVRRHLQEQVRSMYDMMQQSAKSGNLSADAADFVTKEMDALHDLLQEETAARREAEQARLQGSDALSAYQ